MTGRIASIESFRVLAIFTVILWHTDFGAHLTRPSDLALPVVITKCLIWWIGVPYFFIAAGYFFRQSVLTHGDPILQFRRYVSPLAWLLLVWLCIYFVLPGNWPGAVLHDGLWQPFYAEALKNIDRLTTLNIRLFLEGLRPVFHLWFLPALIFSLAILTLMAVGRLQRYVIPLIISVYVLAITEEVAGASFFKPTIELGTWSIALLLTAIGWWLAGREQPSLAMACCLIVAGYTFALIEGEVMSAFFHSSHYAIRHHRYLGGLFLGLGIFLLALAKPQLGRSTPFPFLGQFTLGIYLSHILVISTLGPIESRLRIHSPWSEYLIAVVVYIFSVLFTLALAKLPIARYLVMKPSWRHRRRAITETQMTDKRIQDHIDSQTPYRAV
jgi:surface polysaccharide O-acyltransferase-like enzyme